MRLVNEQCTDGSRPTVNEGRSLSHWYVAKSWSSGSPNRGCPEPVLRRPNARPRTWRTRS